MKPVFLAAGRGRRFGKSLVPKPLLKIGGKTLMERSLDSVINAGLKNPVIVLGHLGDKIKKYIREEYNGTEISYAFNPHFLKTNTMHSLYCAKKFIDSDILLLESDLIYEPLIIKKILEYEKKNFLVISNLTQSDDKVLVSSEDSLNITEIGKSIIRRMIVGEFIGISKLSKGYLEQIFNFFEEQYIKKDATDYCENVFLNFSKKYKMPLSYLSIGNLSWSEIDTKEDVQRAEKVLEKILLN